MGELDEKETSPPNQNNQQSTESEEPKETDKMLAQPDKKLDTKIQIEPMKTSTPEKKLNTQNGEEIINIPDAINDESKKIDDLNDKKNDCEKKSKKKLEDREVKPKKIPIGGIKMPGFFTKIKPTEKRNDGDGAEGELLTKDADDKIGEEKKTEEQQPAKQRNIGERIRNFFSRKQPAANDCGGGDGKKDDDKVNESKIEDNNKLDENQQPPMQKRSLLNAIKLPIANMLPKRNKTDDDVEMGTGPGTKAGLASMETLDDSLKDQDCVDKALPTSNGDGLEKLKGSQEIKPDDEKIAEEDKPIERVPLLDRIRSYTCSIDDALIVLGIVLFILLLVIIGWVLSTETLSQAPIRDGKYIDAVTTCGLVEGLIEDGTYTFRGIPYAEQPIGENRFTNAKLINNVAHCWNGTLKAHNSSEICAQILANGTKVGVEDCLYLDIVTPHVRYDNPVPVVVLIGADSLIGGSPNILRPSPRFARYKDIVFVRPNFRMGPFGFLALDTISKSTYPRISGNYALSDILAVLKWIQLNILHFGGDPKSVTLFGHRAGGTLVAALTTSRHVKGLYHRAWVSGASYIYPGRPLQESERRNEEFMNQIQCKDISCLRDASVDQILDAIPDNWLDNASELPTIEENSTTAHEWLVLDGDILQQHPSDVWKLNQEDTTHPKLVLGTTAHEAHTEKLQGKFTNWTSEDIREYIAASKLGQLNLTDEIITKYNATTYQQLVAIISDIRTVCPLLVMARSQPSVPFYVATQTDNRTKLAEVDADIQSILGRYEPHTTEQRRFVSSMQQLFYHYIAHGDMKQFDPRQRILNIGQDPLPFEEYSHCNYWISKDIVPRYARID